MGDAPGCMDALAEVHVRGSERECVYAWHACSLVWTELPDDLPDLPGRFSRRNYHRQYIPANRF